MENKATGYMKIFRSLKTHWLWADEKKLKWWLDILLTANYSDQKVLLKGILVECKRGQTIRSLETWAKDWRTTKKTVQTFLRLLQKDKMILVENVKITTRITVCNYDSYNTTVNTDDTGEETDTTTRGKRTLPPNNKDNKDNKDKKESITLPFLTDSFATAWDEWLDYKKKQQNFSFKTIKSQQQSLNLLFYESHQDEKIAIAMLEYAEAKGWKGWVPKDDVNFYQKSNTPQTGLYVMKERDFYSESEYLDYCKENNITPELKRAI